jgi:hypothetical protein
MQTSAFKAWLQTSYLQKNGQPLVTGTQISRIANCSTIEQVEGDLDEHFERDGMESILRMLTYSVPDYEKVIKPKHHIPIRGNVWNGTTTYRSAANLYRKFRIAQAAVGSQEIDDLLKEMFKVKTTERQALQKIRVGHDRFRSLVLERWDYRCAVTGGGLLLTASHIKPWRYSNNEERLDPFNGICLSPLYDRAFDKGLITFKLNGAIEPNPRFPKHELELLGLLRKAKLNGLSSKHEGYLNYHRTEVWSVKPKDRR